MAKVGYARVSTLGQSLEVQLEKMQLAGCEKIFQEKMSGTIDERPILQECLRYLREGDQFYVTKIDRLARSTLHLCKIGEQLSKEGIDLVVIDQFIDTTTPTGRLTFNILASIAQFETEIRAERQREGIIKAMKRGKRFGREKALSDTQVEELKQARENGTTIKDLMDRYALSKTSIYRYLLASMGPPS